MPKYVYYFNYIPLVENWETNGLWLETPLGRLKGWDTVKGTGNLKSVPNEGERFHLLAQK